MSAGAHTHPLTAAEIDDKISSLVLAHPAPRAWRTGFAVGLALVLMLNFAIAWLFIQGIGIWGVNVPVAWGFAIVNFVFWVGIAHAGTLISAILLLARQGWRTSINRFAEATTLFALACAGMFPILHLGRPAFFYWLFPYPSTTGIWPQFRSPLMWDVFAVSTYGTVSLLFWYLGLIPDLGMMRDKARNPIVRRIFAVFALGWRGSAMQWSSHRITSLILAALATPLVVSVHSIVSFDFSVSIVPGWHSTIFPPYFVAGAICSGFAMVLTLAIPLRKIYGLEKFITERHLENMGKLLMVTSLFVSYSYIIEAFISWYSGSIFERFLLFNRAFGPYGYMYWLVLTFVSLSPLVLFFRRARRSMPALFVVAILANTGMWMERYVIVVVSLHRDYLPSSWFMYAGTRWDWMIMIGAFGLFATLFFLFIRLVPAISSYEMKEMLHHEAKGHTA